MERFCTAEDVATGFVGMPLVNSNRGLLGPERVLPRPRPAADGRVHTITRRIGRCASGILLETKAYKNIPAELLGEGDLYASHSTVLAALAHTRQCVPILWARVCARLLHRRPRYVQQRYQANLLGPVCPRGAAVRADLSARPRRGVPN